MIMHLFDVLTHALKATPFIALGAALCWGVLSILLSPCHLASIPLIVGLINDQGAITTKRAFLVSLLFSVGILITIAAIGMVTALTGRLLGDVGVWGNYLVAAIFFIVGFHLLGLFPLPFAGRKDQSDMKQKGLVAAFFLGLIFGIALGPCSFAYMAPLIALTFSLSSTHFFYGFFLLGMYGIGHCSVIVLAGTCTKLVERYLQWNEGSKGTRIIKKICGALVIFGGVYLVVSRNGV